MLYPTGMWSTILINSGTLVQWYNGTLVQWYLVQWYTGTMSGTIVHWYIGTSWFTAALVHIVEWYSPEWYTGTMVDLYSGTMVQ